MLVERSESGTIQHHSKEYGRSREGAALTVWIPLVEDVGYTTRGSFGSWAADQGLNLMAATKVTKSSTEEKVQSFVDTNNLQFPVFKEDGRLSQYFNVSGIPAAAVVKDGKVIWRGHPANISDEMLAGWL